MHPQDMIQAEIQDLRKQIQETRMEIRTTSSRLDGIWWKIGLMAGFISILMTEVYGHGIGGVVGDILGWWPL